MVEKNDYEAFMWVNNEWQMLNNELVTVKTVPEDHVTTEQFQALVNQVNQLTGLTLTKIFVGNKNNLPETGNDHTLYFVANNSNETNNIHDEYVYNTEDNDYELIGQQVIETDLTDYYTKTEVDNLIGNITTYLDA